MADKQNELTSIQGTISRITYQHPESHYTVARLDEDGGPGATVVGMLFPVSEGEEIKVTGVWKRHARYGLQFQVDHWTKVDPATLEGIEKYLGSGMIKGIGPTYAKRLVGAFGLDTLRVLSEEPLRVLDVDGIGEVRARRIMEAWQAQRGMQDVMVFLQGHGVGASLALRIYRVFGADTVAQVRENPYALAQQVHGIGFLLADRLAGHIGIRGDFPLRVQAGVLHVLRESSERGHCYLAVNRAGQRALANCSKSKTSGSISRSRSSLSAARSFCRASAIRTSPAFIWLSLFEAEQTSRPSACPALDHAFVSPRRTAAAAVGERPGRWPRRHRSLSGALFADLPINLDEDQVSAARRALQEKVFVITGGPGTGKTTLLMSLLAILRRAKVTFALAAPTGRAAKRMTESTGEDATTIHRLLEYNPREGGFQRNEDNPLQVDVVIVDEASMVDIALMDHLLRAIDPHSHLILVGDVDQLPSVGPGSVLKDLIDSQSVPVATLRRIFRQERESLIVVNAHRILQGQNLEFSDARERRDFDFIARESEEEILATIKELLRERIPQWLGAAPEQIVQSVQAVDADAPRLARHDPTQSGVAGAAQSNRPSARTGGHGVARARQGHAAAQQLRQRSVQRRSRPDRSDRPRGWQDSRRLSTIGLSSTNPTSGMRSVSPMRRRSIKARAANIPSVVLPLHTSHYMMLYRSILYTAVTRGKKLVIVVGSRKALGMAIRNVRVEIRNTGLKERLIGALATHHSERLF